MPAPRRVKYWEGFDSIADRGVFTVDTTGWRLTGACACGCGVIGVYTAIGEAGAVGVAAVGIGA